MILRQHSDFRINQQRVIRSLSVVKCIGQVCKVMCRAADGIQRHQKVQTRRANAAEIQRWFTVEPASQTLGQP